MAQPTVTKSVRALEHELQAQLLERNARGVIPTAAGRAFFARARVAQIELRNAEAEVARLSGAGEPSVAFGVGPGTAMALLPEALKLFRQEFPGARLRITEALGHVLWALVREATLDLAVGLRPDLKREHALRFRPLARMAFAVVVRRGHPLRKARSLGQLGDVEWLSLLPPSASGDAVERMFSAARLSAPRRLIQCDSHLTMITLLANTDMVGTISRWMLGEPAVRSALEEIPVSEPLGSVTIGVITRAEPPLTPVAAALSRAVTAAARRRRAELPG